MPTRVGLSHLAQTTCTSEMWIVPGFSKMPPSGCWGVLRRWRLTRRRPSTVTRWASRSIFSTLPRLVAGVFSARSAPAMTWTVSPTLSFSMVPLPPRGPPDALLEDLGSERDDLHELAGAELAGHRPEDARPDGLHVLVDEDGGVAIEFDVAAIRTAHLARGAHDDRLGHITLLHLGVRQRLAHRHDDHIADGRVFALRTAKHLDAEHLLGARVVGHVEHARHLNHLE